MGLHDLSPAVEVEAVHYQVGSAVLLRDLTFQVPRGGVFGLLGPNGAGKTTSLRILLGKLRPQAGRVQVLGESPWRAPRAWKARLGWMGEAPGHYGRLTVQANLSFFASLYGLGRGDWEPLLQRFGLWERRDVPAASISKGQKQKLALARALVARPELLFLDEPTSGLDVESARQLREFVRDWAHAEQRTVIVTTHDMEEADQLCDHIAFIEAGSIVAEGTPEELVRKVLQVDYVKRSERAGLEQVYLKLREQFKQVTPREYECQNEESCSSS